MGPSVPDEVLLEASSEPIESLETLLDRCLPSLTAHIWQTCCWRDASELSTIGDYRFSVVQFEPLPDVALYVQLWSEPGEPALMEVSSGAWNPRAIKYVWRAQRRILEDRGFMVGGVARNFQKELTITSPEDAETVAREALAIFFDVLGYRGLQPLTMTLERGSRAEQRPAHTSFAPEDFIKIAEQRGFRASLLVAESPSPVVTLQRGTFKGLAIFCAPIAYRNLFAAVHLRADVGAESSLPLPEQPDDQLPALRVVAGQGRVTADVSLMFDGGVTAEWVGNRMDRWRKAARTYRRLMVRRTKRSGQGEPAAKRPMSIH
jgi:hypothetical protein